MINQNRLEKEIWKKFVEPIAESLFQGTIPFYLIQYYFNQNRSIIEEKYGKLQLILREHAPITVKGVSLLFMCCVADGLPQIHIFLAEMERRIFEIQKYRKHFQTDDFQKVDFEIKQIIWNSILIGFMHETDHFFLSIIGGNPSVEEIIEGEMIVWDRTCENTIRSLVECGQKLAFGEWKIYEAWVKCGRNRHSEEWRKYITKTVCGF